MKSPRFVVLSGIIGQHETSVTLERMMRSFLPVVDAFAFAVHPDGPPIPDVGRPFQVVEYHNKVKGWDHVDDFAAKRNASWELTLRMGATAILWADCDDVLAEESIPVLEQAWAKDWDVLICRYDVKNAGHRHVPRERVFRGPALELRWVGAIHERVDVPEHLKIAVEMGAVWVHLPNPNKTPGGRERNLRILRHITAEAGRGFYYLAQEAWNVNDHAEHRRCAQIALLAGVPACERYELEVQLGTTDPGNAEAHFARAFSLMPYRREALAHWTLWLASAGRYEDAYQMCLRMHQIPWPHVLHWTHQARWYQAEGVRLLCAVARLTGRNDVAEKNEADLFERGGRKISLCHATRGRPEKALHTRAQWLNLADNGAGVEHIFAVDHDDAQTLGAVRPFKHVVVSPGGSCVRAWNAAAEAAEGKVLVQLSDDWQPFPGWDTAILEALGERIEEPAVLAVGDGHRADDLLCMAILTRKRWETQGREMFSSEYESVFSDNEFSHRAFRDGVVIDARDRITFEHQHPVFGAGEWDETYRRNNAEERYKRGRATFWARNPDATRER